MIKVGNIITLSNNKDYVVSSIVYKDDVMYLYLVSTDMKEIKICYLEEDEVVEVSNKNKLEEIINLLVEDLNK